MADFISEEQALAEALDRLDRDEPGWDRDARVAAARSFLKTLCTRDQAIQIYGEDIVAEAEALNANEGK